MVTKICSGDYARIPTAMPNFITIRFGNFVPTAYAKFQITRLGFFGFWLLDAPNAVAPILSVNMSKDVVSRKDVPFDGPESKFLPFDLILAKNANFWSIFDGT